MAIYFLIIFKNSFSTIFIRVYIEGAFNLNKLTFKIMLPNLLREYFTIFMELSYHLVFLLIMYLHQ